jgi:hypothetical protein
MTTALVALCAALAAAVALLVWNQRQQETLFDKLTASLLESISRQDDRLVARDARVRELEDALYAKHAAVLELPNINRVDPPAPADAPLPAAVQQFIDGFTEPEARDEFTEDARRILAANPRLASADVIARLAGGVTAG